MAGFTNAASEGTKLSATSAGELGEKVDEIKFSGFAAHFHIAPILLQMEESQEPNLMRLQLNTILPPCYALQAKLELKDQKNKETAGQLLFNTEQRMYKYWDHRCLVPYSHKDPTKWKTYEMHDYRRAFDTKTLKSVDQYKYDNNFFNWVDPKVLEYFATKPKRAWRKTYGYPYSTLRSWDGAHLPRKRQNRKM